MDKEFLLLLLSIKGVGNAKVLKALRNEFRQKIDSPFSLDEDELLKLVNDFLFLKKKVSKNELLVALEVTRNIVKKCLAQKIKIVSYLDQDYPLLFRKIKNPPIILYYQGDITLLNEKVNIGVIGTRTPSMEAKKFGTQIVGLLVKNQVVIVSGLAAGSDTVAHAAALDNKGKTVAFLPSAIDEIYPTKNKALAQRIVANKGCLISEYAPGTRAEKFYFAQRDRLQSASSAGLIILETELNGGTIITASYAKEHKRLLAAFWKDEPDFAEIRNRLGNKKLVEEAKAQKIKNLEDLELFINDCIEYRQLYLLPEAKSTVEMQFTIFEEQKGCFYK